MLSRNSNRLLPAIDMSKATIVGARAEHKVRRPAPRRQSNKVREGWTAFAFLVPSLIGFGLFVFGPILAVFLISFFDWSLLSDPEFIGMENYSQLASDARVGSVYKTTLLIAALSVVLNIVLGLAIALLLESQLSRWTRTIFRMTYVFPYIVSATAVALIWRFLLNRDLGLVNYLLGFLSIDRINWLGSSAWAPISVVIVYTWKALGFSILIFLAGLQGIPNELKEAATVDGAGSWKQFTKIVLPLLSPTIFFLIVINTINAFQIFAEPVVLTEGGPGDSSRTIVQFIYEKAFRSFEMGYASAIAMSLFVVLLIATAIQFRLSRRWTFYG